MRNSAVQISLWDIYNGVSESMTEQKPELIRLLEEHIDFGDLMPLSFYLAFYRGMGRSHVFAKADWNFTGRIAAVDAGSDQGAQRLLRF